MCLSFTNNKHVLIPATYSGNSTKMVFNVDDFLTPYGLVMPSRHGLSTVDLIRKSEFTQISSRKDEYDRIFIVAGDEITNILVTSEKECRTEVIKLREHYHVTPLGTYYIGISVALNYAFSIGIVKTPKEVLRKIKKPYCLSSSYMKFTHREIEELIVAKYGKRLPLPTINTLNWQLIKTNAEYDKA